MPPPFLFAALALAAVPSTFDAAVYLHGDAGALRNRDVVKALRPHLPALLECRQTAAYSDFHQLNAVLVVERDGTIAGVFLASKITAEIEHDCAADVLGRMRLPAPTKRVAVWAEIELASPSWARSLQRGAGDRPDGDACIVLEAWDYRTSTDRPRAPPYALFRLASPALDECTTRRIVDAPSSTRTHNAR